MSGKPYVPTIIDEHIGQRLQLRRSMMGMSQKDLADVCGVTFQQIQKYESAGNRISASRLYELSRAMETPISFFFAGLPGYLPPERRTPHTGRVSDLREDDPLSKNESLQLVKLYWKLSDNDKRETIMRLLRSLNGMDNPKPEEK